MSGTYGPALGSGGDRGVVSGPQHRVVRKISRQGNSLTVSLPPLFLRMLNLLPGDELELLVAGEWGGIFVRPTRPRDFRPVPSLGKVIAEGVSR